jgi:hypothetical protein
MSKLAEKIARLAGTNSKTAWKAVRECELGNKINHKKKTMALKLPNGQSAKTDKENMSIFRPNCIRIFNNHRIVLQEALDFIKKQETYAELDNPITWEEFKTAVNGMKNDKSPGANGVTVEAFKAMNATNLQEVYHLKAFWDGTRDFSNRHQADGTPVPKIRNPDDPNKYQIVSLIDVCSKIFSRILCARSYKLLAKHGTKHQYGATPNCGCQGGNFTLKSILYLRQQHNQDTYVVFADLVKAYDTYNHELMLKILEQYGALTKFQDSIKRLYTNLKVIVKIGKETAEIDQEVGVRQGGNVSLVIFLFLKN